MLRKTKYIVLLLGIAVFTLAILSWHSSTSHSLPATQGFVLSQDNEGEVYLEARALSERETKEYVNRDLVGRGYQPVLLQIDNTSPFAYEIKKEHVNIKIADAKKVAKEIKYFSLPRVISYKILSFFFWPFIIPDTIDSIRTCSKMYAIEKQLYAKTLKERGEIIPAYSSLTRVLYIPQDEIQESFKLALKNLDEQRTEIFFLLIEDLPA